jgi:hypothetical protein
MNAERNLTDDDVEAIVDAFEKRFYLNLGKGFWSYVWKAIVLVLIGVAGYGALHK